MGKFGPTLIAGLLLISHFMAGPSFAEDQAVLRPIVLIPRAITGLGSYGPIGDTGGCVLRLPSACISGRWDSSSVCLSQTTHKNAR